ncbi:MAG: protein translocase SEC61 complex subunit gamma [Candidatus Micrarchaeaceae archaeon]
MNIQTSIKKFITNARHVMSISYKPTREEYEKAAKLIILGILLLGTIGFIVAILVSLVITGSLSLI